MELKRLWLGSWALAVFIGSPRAFAAPPSSTPSNGEELTEPAAETKPEGEKSEKQQQDTSAGITWALIDCLDEAPFGERAKKNLRSCELDIVGKRVAEIADSLEHTMNSESENPLYFRVGDGKDCSNAPPRWQPACTERKDILAQMRELADELKRTEKRSDPRTQEELLELRKRFQDLGGRIANFDALRRGRVSLAVRGGISVGSYQSGFMYYFSEFMKAHHEQWRAKKTNYSAERWDHDSPNEAGLLYNFETVTGASAGSINAMITAVEGCKSPVLRPEDSSFFQSWIEIGLTGRHGRLGLIPMKDSDSKGFLSFKPIDRASARLAADAEYNHQTVPGCQLDLGVTVTRVNGTEFPVVVDKEGEALLSVRRARERFVFDLDFQANKSDAGGHLVVNNRRPRPPLRQLDFPQPDPANAIETFYLSLGDGKPEVSVRDLMRVVTASGAFPVAFPPQKLSFTALDAKGEPDQAESGEALFIDGGIFDNKPIGLAMDLNDWRRRRQIERLIECTIGLCTKDFWMLTAEERMQLGEVRARLARARSVKDWDEARDGLDAFAKHIHSTTREFPGVQGQQCADAGSTPSDDEQKPSVGPDDTWTEINEILPKHPRTLLFVEPTVTSWKTPEEDGGPHVVVDGFEQDFFGVLFKFLGSFVGSALQASLMDTIERRPWLREQRTDTLTERIVVPRRHLPIAGEMLARFMGFFERDFRVFDFFVGMADAKRFIEEDPVFRLSGANVAIDDPRFDCMLAYYDRSSGGAENVNDSYSEGMLPAACRREALLTQDDVDTIALISPQIEALKGRVVSEIHEEWSRPPYTPAEQRELEAVESLVAAENFGAMLVAMHNFRRYMAKTPKDERKSSSDFDEFFGALDDASYQFVDTERVRAEVDPPLVKLRRRSPSRQMKQTVRMAMEEAIDRFARRQPKKAGEAGVSILFKAAADAYAPYSPQLAIDLGLTFNGIHARLAGYPTRNRFRIDYLVLSFYRIGKGTLLEEGDDASRGRYWLADLDLSVARLGLRYATLAKVLRLEATLGLVTSLTLNLGPVEDDRGALLMTRLGPQLGLDLLLLRRIYVELTGSYFVGQWQGPEYGVASTSPPTFYTGSRGSPRSCAQLDRASDFTRCAQFSASVGWRWNF